ncbi:hypothetical protein DFJ77DRAFT_474288 [Powellomyces hirtus]|nr:hypothetical protein DFJ77DRAFT_474288 [Powellomyces hirtus]
MLARTVADLLSHPGATFLKCSSPPCLARPVWGHPCLRTSRNFRASAVHKSVAPRSVTGERSVLARIVQNAEERKPSQSSSEGVPRPPVSRSDHLLDLVKRGDADRAIALFVELDFRKELQALSVSDYNQLLRLVQWNTRPRGKQSINQMRVFTAEKIVQAMVRNRVQPNSVTYSIMADAYARNGQLADVDAILKHVAAKGWTLNNGAQVRMLAQCAKNPDEALAALRGFLTNAPEEAQNARSVYEGLVRAFSRDGNLQGLNDTLKVGKEFNIPTDAKVYDALIYHFAINTGQMEEARAMLDRRAMDGFGRGTQAYNALLRGYLKKRQWHAMARTVNEMQANKVPLSVSTYNIILNMYAVQKKPLPAMTVYLQMIAKAKLTPTDETRMLLACAVQHHESKVYHLIYRAGGKPGAALFRTLVVGSLKAENPDLALRYMDEYRRHHNISPRRFPLEDTLNLELAAYCRKGDVARAEAFFAEYFADKPSNTYGYNAMILMYSREFRTDDALAIYEHMRRFNIKPDAFTFNGLVASSLGEHPQMTPLTIRFLRELVVLKVDVEHLSLNSVRGVHAALRVVGHGDFEEGVRRIETEEEIDISTLPPFPDYIPDDPSSSTMGLSFEDRQTSSDERD